MEVAITADIHLTTKSTHPERYDALENILLQSKERNIEHLIIAGDLFDKDFRGPAEFEQLCRNFPQIQLHIIPGNHDMTISEKSIVGSNVHIYTNPTLVEIGNKPFIFIPYEERAKMCDRISSLNDDSMEDCVLVGHGDYYGGIKELNPLEPGTYMPLSKNDISKFGPCAVFLGHIHKPSSFNKVYYAGSPCGLDICERGKRRFLVYDTEGGTIESIFTTTDVIYFVETFVIVPLENEVELLKQEIADRIESWNVPQPEFSKVVVRVEAIGYAMDRSSIMSALNQGFKEFKYYNNEGPLIDKLLASLDRQLSAIAQRVMKLIDELEWDYNDDEPDRELLKIQALNVIYGD